MLRIHIITQERRSTESVEKQYDEYQPLARLEREGKAKEKTTPARVLVLGGLVPGETKTEEQDTVALSDPKWERSQVAMLNNPYTKAAVTQRKYSRSQLQLPLQTLSGDSSIQQHGTKVLNVGPKNLDKHFNFNSIKRDFVINPKNNGVDEYEDFAFKWTDTEPAPLLDISSSSQDESSTSEQEEDVESTQVLDSGVDSEQTSNSNISVESRTMQPSTDSGREEDRERVEERETPAKPAVRVSAMAKVWEDQLTRREHEIKETTHIHWKTSKPEYLGWNRENLLFRPKPSLAEAEPSDHPVEDDTFESCSSIDDIEADETWEEDHDYPVMDDYIQYADDNEVMTEHTMPKDANEASSSTYSDDIDERAELKFEGGPRVLSLREKFEEMSSKQSSREHPSAALPHTKSLDNLLSEENHDHKSDWQFRSYDEPSSQELNEEQYEDTSSDSESSMADQEHISAIEPSKSYPGFPSNDDEHLDDATWAHKSQDVPIELENGPKVNSLKGMFERKSENPEPPARPSRSVDQQVVEKRRSQSADGDSHNTRTDSYSQADSEGSIATSEDEEEERADSEAELSSSRSSLSEQERESEPEPESDQEPEVNSSAHLLPPESSGRKTSVLELREVFAHPSPSRSTKSVEEPELAHIPEDLREFFRSPSQENFIDEDARREISGMVTQFKEEAQGYQYGQQQDTTVQKVNSTHKLEKMFIPPISFEDLTEEEDSDGIEEAAGGPRRVRRRSMERLRLFESAA